MGSPHRFYHVDHRGRVGRRVIITIGLLSLITLRGLYFAKKCQDSFGTLLCLCRGISSMVGSKATVNLGAINGILLITGVTSAFC